jgi:hypothetical protein
VVSSASAAFDHAFAGHLVDRGLGERGGDGPRRAAVFAVVGDALGVGAQVAVELAHRLSSLVGSPSGCSVSRASSTSSVGRAKEITQCLIEAG